jgi:hypothetical protein
MPGCPCCEAPDALAACELSLAGLPDELIVWSQVGVAPPYEVAVTKLSEWHWCGIRVLPFPFPSVYFHITWTVVDGVWTVSGYGTSSACGVTPEVVTGLIFDPIAASCPYAPGDVDLEIIASGLTLIIIRRP